MSSTDSTTSQELLQKKQFLSKIKGMKETLEILIRKKIRLEFEIRNLRRALRTKTKNFKESETSLKFNVGLEGQLLEVSDPNLPVSSQELELAALDSQIREEIESCRDLTSSEISEDLLEKILTPGWIESMMIRQV